MSEETPEGDGIVRAALQLLPIPPHNTDFWGRLDEALDAVDPAKRPETVEVPAPPPVADAALAVVPPALRRPSNVVLVAIAAATVVVVALAGLTLVDQRDGSGGSANEDAAAITAPTDPAALEIAPTITLSSSGEEAASEAVLAWVDDVGGGSAGAAWDALGPSSQAHFGSREVFDAQMTDVAAGYAGWSDQEPSDVYVTPVADSEQGLVAVVTLVGASAEGSAVTAAVPVRMVDGTAKLEPFALAGSLEMVAPTSETPTVGINGEVVLVVPDGAQAPILRLDDGLPAVCGAAEGSELARLEGGSGQRCGYSPPGGITPGDHTLTVAYLGAEGESVSAQSMLFEAA